jgi:predicted exporter
MALTCSFCSDDPLERLLHWRNRKRSLMDRLAVVVAPRIERQRNTQRRRRFGSLLHALDILELGMSNGGVQRSKGDVNVDTQRNVVRAREKLNQSRQDRRLRHAKLDERLPEESLGRIKTLSWHRGKSSTRFVAQRIDLDKTVAVEDLPGVLPRRGTRRAHKPGLLFDAQGGHERQVLVLGRQTEAGRDAREQPRVVTVDKDGRGLLPVRSNCRLELFHLAAVELDKLRDDYQTHTQRMRHRFNVMTRNAYIAKQFSSNQLQGSHPAVVAQPPSGRIDRRRRR